MRETIRKYFCLMFAAILPMACAVPATAASSDRVVGYASSGECVAGDVDGDGRVTPADARLALRISVNLMRITADQTCYADADGDGRVTSADARLILRYSVALETDGAMQRFTAPPKKETSTVSFADKHEADFVILQENDTVSLGDRHLIRAGDDARWESSNPAAVTVSENVTVRAVKKGIACVHLTINGERYYYFFEVRTPLQTRIYALQEKYPDGYFWNDYPKSERYPAVTETPCTDHSTGAYAHCLGQCAGFAEMLSEEVFGYYAPVRRNLTVDEIRIGDYVRCLPGHSVFVIDRINAGEVIGYNAYLDINVTADEDIIIVAECNWDCRCGIRWGRMIRLNNLSIDSYETYTRY